MYPKSYFSQFKQDKFVNEVIFAGKRNGYFIDIGAHDGISLSNTYFFEKYKDWSGICFEPNPSTFSFLEKNRNCKVVNKCIGEDNLEINFCKVEGPANMLSGIYSSYEEKHIQRIKNEIEAYGGSFELILVPMVPLSDFLNDHQIIDFLSIDTEGNEFSILKSIDFSKNHFICISIENNYNNSKIKEFLINNKFLYLTRLGVDEVYLNRKNYTLFVFFRLKIWIIKRKITNGFIKLAKKCKSLFLSFLSFNL